jgi:hypothetical protein
MGHLAGIHIGTPARALAAALALGAAILSPVAGSVQAGEAPPSHDLGIQCPWVLPDGQITYYGVGVIIVHIKTGLRQKCGPDGNWHVVPFNNAGDAGPVGTDGVFYAP